MPIDIFSMTPSELTALELAIPEARARILERNNERLLEFRETVRVFLDETGYQLGDLFPSVPRIGRPPKPEKTGP